MESFPSSIVARYGVELSNVTRKNSWNSGYGDKNFRRIDKRLFKVKRHFIFLIANK